MSLSYKSRYQPLGYRHALQFPVTSGLAFLLAPKPVPLEEQKHSCRGLALYKNTRQATIKRQTIAQNDEDFYHTCP